MERSPALAGLRSLHRHSVPPRRSTMVAAVGRWPPPRPTIRTSPSVAARRRRKSAPEPARPVSVSPSSLLALPSVATTIRRRRWVFERFPGRDRGFEREVDASEVVNLLHHDRHLVADVHDVRHLRDVVRREFGDVDEPLLLRQDLDERAEVQESRHLSAEDLTNLHLAREVLDPLDRARHPVRRYRRDEDEPGL